MTSVARTIGRGVAWSTLSSGIGKIIVLANIFIILRSLSVYEYGLSELVFSVIGTAGIALLPGLSTAIQADISHLLTRGATADAREIFNSYTVLNFILGACLCAGLFVLAGPVALLVGNISIGYFLKIVSFMFILSPLRMTATMLAQITLRFADQSLYSVVEEAAKGIILFVSLVLLHKGIEGLLYTVVLSQLAAFLLYLPRSVSAYALLGHEKSAYKVRFRDLVQRHRKWSITSSYVSNLTSSLQIWLIRAFLGTEAVGLYAIASGIVSQITAFLPLGTVLAPIAPAYTDRADEMRRLIRASIKIQLVLAIILCLLGWAGLPLFIYFFPKYAGARVLASILIITVVPLGIANVLTPIFAAYKAQFSFLLSTSIKFILIAALFPLGIYFFGIVGTALASLLVSVLSMSERYLRLTHLYPKLRIHFRDLVTLSSEELGYVRVLVSRSRLLRFFVRF